jgi:hypothetical protein
MRTALPAPRTPANAVPCLTSAGPTTGLGQRFDVVAEFGAQADIHRGYILDAAPLDRLEG